MGFFKPNVRRMWRRGNVKGLVRALRDIRSSDIGTIADLAVHALISIGIPAIPHLLEALEDDEIWGKAAAAIRDIASGHDDEGSKKHRRMALGLPEVIELLHKSNRKVRARARRILEESLRRKPDLKAYSAAIGAGLTLGLWGLRSHIEEATAKTKLQQDAASNMIDELAKGDDPLEVLKHYLTLGRESVKRRGRRTELGEFRAWVACIIAAYEPRPEVESLLIDALLHDKDDEVKSTTLSLLAELGPSTEVIAALSKALALSRKEAEQAAVALAAYGPEAASAVPPLIKAFRRYTFSRHGLTVENFFKSALESVTGICLESADEYQEWWDRSQLKSARYR